MANELPPDPPLESEASEVAPPTLGDEDRILLAFAYLGPLVLVPLFGSRDPFVRWHARQGLWLTVAAAAVAVLLYPFHWLFSLVPVLGRLFLAAELLVGLGYLALVALAIARALDGGRFRIPWLADLADQD
ncbi:MAG: hypothetical protein D6718_01760 [Acidobacteria bacterium]|nr:MAG: hypothetical protein D6718_01760 [Acidobacteriota bacterium]